MNPRHAITLMFVLLSLMVGGCAAQPPIPQVIDAEFTLKTTQVDGRMVFAGVGGDIDEVVNPELVVHKGDTIRLVIVNGDGMPHDLAIPDLDVHTSLVTSQEQTADAVVQATQAGSYAYYCTVSGHRQMGMEGVLIVSKP